MSATRAVCVLLGGAGSLACVLSLAPLALAAGPLTITSPGPNSVTSDPTPVFAGAREGEPRKWEQLTVTVRDKNGVVEAPSTEFEAAPGPTWFLETQVKLSDGIYTAEAEEGEPPRPSSTPVTFRVDTTPPGISISSPAPGALSAGGAVSFAGQAGTAEGDQAGVIVELFSGAASEGVPVLAVEVQSRSGAWAGSLTGVAPGAYTLRAEQSDNVGNVGYSAPIHVTVLAPPAPARPTASFQPFPASPRVGEPVSLVSTSADPGSPITSYAWGLSASGPLQAGGPVLVTTFKTPGLHSVQLRVGNAAGLSATASGTIDVRPAAATVMQPFPIVRIAGRETRRGVRLTLLTVTAPVTSRVTVRLRRAGARTDSLSLLANAGRRAGAGNTAVVSFPRFARALPAGAVLEVRVTKSGEIGKLTRFVPHIGRLPTRTDSCLTEGGTPMRCPL